MNYDTALKAQPYLETLLSHFDSLAVTLDKGLGGKKVEEDDN